MKTTILKSCSSVNTILCYTWPGIFLGEKSELFTSNDYSDTIKNKSKWEVCKILYRATDDLLTNVNLSEYNLQYNIEKDKFNNLLTVPLYTNEARSIIGLKEESLKKLENYVFPSSIETNSGTSIGYEKDYFGSKYVDDGDLYLLSIPENCWKLELYEDSIYQNGSYDKFYDYYYKSLTGYSLGPNKTPNIVITFGPDMDEYLNDSSYYDPGQVYNGIKYDTTNLSKIISSLSTCYSKWKINNSFVDYYKIYRKLSDEILCSKEVWFKLLDENPNNENVNISSSIFLNSENPLRNKNNYCLRNDDFFGSKDSVNIISSNSADVYINKTSDTIVGTNKVLTTPIKNKKENQLKLDGELYKKYNKNVSYKKGDIVIFKDDYYESIVDNNKNNIPTFSSSWILKDSFDGFFTKCIHFISNPLGAITFSPSYTTIPINNTTPLVINITENNGYSIDDKSSIVAISKSEGNTPLSIESGDLTYLNSKKESSDSYEKTFTIKDWSNIPDDCTKIIFDAKQENIKVNYYIDLEGSLYDMFDSDLKYVDWTFSEKLISENIEVSVYSTIDGKSHTYNKNSIDGIVYNMGDYINVDITKINGSFGGTSDNKSYKITGTKILSKTTSGNVEKTSSLGLSHTVDATEIDMTLYLERKTFPVSVSYNTSDYEVDIPYIEAKYGDSISIKFYSVLNPDTNERKELNLVSCIYHQNYVDKESANRYNYNSTTISRSISPGDDQTIMPSKDPNHTYFEKSETISISSEEILDVNTGETIKVYTLSIDKVLGKNELIIYSK